MTIDNIRQLGLFLTEAAIKLSLIGFVAMGLSEQATLKLFSLTNIPGAMEPDSLSSSLHSLLGNSLQWMLGSLLAGSIVVMKLSSSDQPETNPSFSIRNRMTLLVDCYLCILVLVLLNVHYEWAFALQELAGGNSSFPDDRLRLSFENNMLYNTVVMIYAVVGCTMAYVSFWAIYLAFRKKGTARHEGASQ